MYLGLNFGYGYCFDRKLARVIGDFFSQFHNLFLCAQSRVRIAVKMQSPYGHPSFRHHVACDRTVYSSGKQKQSFAARPYGHSVYASDIFGIYQGFSVFSYIDIDAPIGLV